MTPRQKRPPLNSLDPKTVLAFDRALAVIPPSLRDVLVMRAVEQRGWDEIGELLELNSAELQERHDRALARLRELLDSQHRIAWQAHFGWEESAAALELLAAALSAQSTHETYSAEQWRLDPSLAVCDARMLQYLDSHPEEVMRLSPRDFEVFVAGLLERFGYNVRLAPVGADGGVDIHGTLQLPAGEEYVVVQCKRYKEDHRVPLPVVKQLRIDALDRGANRGLVVTTSWLTKPALSYVATNRYQLAAVDCNELRAWIRKLAAP